MATTYVNDAGTWRPLINIYVNDGGTWRSIQSAYVNDGGTWREVFTNAVVSFFGDSFSRVDDTGGAPLITATFKVDNDGRLYWNIDPTTDSITIKQNWILPNGAVGSNYECRVTVNSGAFSTGTVSTWLNCDTDRTWTLSRNALGSSSVGFTLEIRRTFDGVVLDSANFSILVDEV